jgi:putative ABC transport system permease protein
MISKENIIYSLKNIWERKSRSFLTLLSIFIGIATIFIFVSFGWGLYAYIDEISGEGSADKFTLEGKGFGAPGTSSVELGEDELDVVEGTKGVLEAEGAYFKATEVEQNGVKKYFYLIGADFDKQLIMGVGNVGLYKGRLLKNGDSGKVALGYNYQFDDKNFPKGLNLNDKIKIEGEKYRIVGFLEEVGNPADDANIYMDIDSYEKIFPDESYAMIIGRANIDEMEEVVNRVKKEVREFRDEEEGKEEFNVASFQDQIEAFTGALDIVIAFIILIALISVVVSAVNTANTMVTSVLERIREIGVIKSIGAKNSEIFNIFLFESSFLGLLAGIIGVLLGSLIATIAGASLSALGWGFLQPYQSWTIFAGGIAFATIVGAISGIVPAIQASKLKPVDALRYE